MKLRLIALAAAAVLFSSPAQAQNVVMTQLDSAAVLMRGEGFLPVDEPVLGSLEQGGDAEFELDLQAGVNYVVMGFCDGDCTDLDLVLTNSEGQEVEADRELDDYPVLTMAGGRGGTYVLSVQMATCTVEPCGYGVRVFRNQ